LTVPRGSGLFVAPRKKFPHKFAPELWLNRNGRPGICPAHHLVRFLGSAMIAVLLQRRWIKLKSPAGLRSDRPLPDTLSHYELTLRFSDRAGGAAVKALSI
jgi:hypothetical protein